MIVVNQDKTEFLECDSIKIEVTDGKYSIQARKNDSFTAAGFFESEEKAKKALSEMLSQVEEGKVISVPPSKEVNNPEVERLRKLVLESSPPKTANIDFGEADRKQNLEVMSGVDQDARRNEGNQLFRLLFNGSKEEQ